MPWKLSQICQSNIFVELTAQKKKFTIKDFFGKCDQIRSLHIFWRNP